MTARHPLAPFGLEDRPPLWDTEGPDGTCQRCGEDASRCAEVGCANDPKICTIEDCEKPQASRQWCSMHYTRWLRHGDPRCVLIDWGVPLEERFWNRVDVGHPLGCWEWTGCRNQAGYGNFNAGDGGPTGAHRRAYELLMGPIPPGLQLDHLCRNPACVNPDHLEPVTQQENIARGQGACSKHARKTHCLRGHPFDEANTLITRAGFRSCRTCHRERERARVRKARLHDGEHQARWSA